MKGSRRYVRARPAGLKKQPSSSQRRHNRPGPYRLLLPRECRRKSPQMCSTVQECRKPGAGPFRWKGLYRYYTMVVFAKHAEMYIRRSPRPQATYSKAPWRVCVMYI